MSRPFTTLVHERAKLPHDVLIRNVTQRLTKWQQVSAGKQVSLDEVAWLGAMIHAALALASAKMQESKTHTVVMSDGVATRDTA